MSAATSDDERTFLPDRFPTWPGLIAAVAVAAAWGGLESLQMLPHAVYDWSGGMMIAGHALAALAAFTLFGELFRVAKWRGELEESREEPGLHNHDWPVVALNDARQRLYVRHSTDEIRAEIKKSADLLLDQQEWSWRLGQIVCYLIPAVGFAAALMNLRLEGNTVPWREVGKPLLLGLVEAIPILLLAAAARATTRTLAKEWRLFAERLAVERRPEGFLPNPETEAPVLKENPPTPARPQVAEVRGASRPGGAAPAADVGPRQEPKPQPPSPPKPPPEPRVEPDKEVKAKPRVQPAVDTQQKEKTSGKVDEAEPWYT